MSKRDITKSIGSLECADMDFTQVQAKFSFTLPLCVSASGQCAPRPERKGKKTDNANEG